MKQIVFLFIFLSFFVRPVSAQIEIPPDKIYKAQVVEILEEGEKEIVGTPQLYQKLKLRLLDGEDSNKEVEMVHGGVFSVSPDQKVRVGDTVVLTQTSDGYGNDFYVITDTYRLPYLMWLAGAFAVLILVMGRWRGLGSLIGLAISFYVITSYIVPSILAGQDPVIVSILGGVGTAAITMYLAHGWKAHTHMAVAGTLITLAFTGVLSVVIVGLTRLTGLGSEEAYSLQLGLGQTVQFKGLLLAGIIIGVLGILDDVTSSQAAAVYELDKVNKRLSFFALLRSGLTIGQEHISSLVNTLVLAYAGASLPLFLFLVMNPLNHPAWVILNSEFMAEEIVRTLVGSFGLVLAVPITTVLAVWNIKRRRHA